MGKKKEYRAETWSVFSKNVSSTHQPHFKKCIPEVVS